MMAYVDITEVGVNIHLVGGWAGLCKCGFKRWVDSGWVIYIKFTGLARGWAGYGVYGEACPMCPNRRVKPMVLEDQLPFVALYRIGGEKALTAALPVWPHGAPIRGW